MTRVLLVEDNETLLSYYRRVMEGAGLAVDAASNGAEGLDLFTRRKPDVVALDLMLPDRDGLELMRDCLSLNPSVRFVVVTAFGTIKTAVEAMRHGAFEFLPKPFGDSQLLAAVERAAAHRISPVTSTGPGATMPIPANDESAPGALDAMRPQPLEGFIGQSTLMQELYRRCRAVSRSDVPVFLVGPTGSGRESCARQIHAMSSRAGGPFVSLAADSLDAATQLQILSGPSELVSRAAGGTVYVGTPAALSSEAQGLLLNQISRLEFGDSRNSQAPQIISASTGDPFCDVKRGALREDLFHRLYVAPITVPRLHDRGEDVIAIANHALRRFETRAENGIVGLDPEVAAMFREHPWPGNVRQLMNVVRSAIVLNEGPLLTLEMLPPDFVAQARVDVSQTTNSAIQDLAGLSLNEIERQVIEATIAAQGGSIPKAARVLDVSPSTIYRKREVWAADGEPA